MYVRSRSAFSMSCVQTSQDVPLVESWGLILLYRKHTANVEAFDMTCHLSQHERIVQAKMQSVNYRVPERKLQLRSCVFERVAST